MTLSAKHRIALKAIQDKGGLWVPQTLSRETANGLFGRGWIKVMNKRSTPSGNSVHLFVDLTDAGIAALNQP